MLNVGYAVHCGDWNFEKVNSPFTRIYYVTRGEAQIMISDTTYSLTPGNMYMIPAFTEHRDICDGEFEHFYLHIYEQASSKQGLTNRFDFPVEISGTELDVTLFRYLCDHNTEMALKFSDPRIYDNKYSLIECVRLNRARPLFDRLESAGIIYQIFGRFMRFAKPKFQTSDPRIEDALRKIASFSDEVTTVETLAREACMSKDHFIRLFRRDLGQTPAQFIINEKMTKAKLMLASENMPVKEIAFSLGYYDLSYFHRQFKKHAFLTPNQYRNCFNQQS